MAFKSTLVFLFACQHICCVMAAECTTAIIASIFGTIGVLLVVAAIVALAWYCYKRGQAGKKLLTAISLLARLCKTLFILPPLFKRRCSYYLCCFHSVVCVHIFSRLC